MIDSKFNVKKYLERIGFNGDPTAPDLAMLARLQRMHLLAVPFENLDIHWNRHITLDLAKFYKKIVSDKRGGFCYELNGLFNELLIALGFATRIVSARVFNGKGHGPEFDHAAIIVKIGADEYLSDVGFGAFTTEPLRFAIDAEQLDPSGSFVIRKRDADYYEVLKGDAGVWRSEYIFQDIERELGEFSEMCDFQQFSSESHFTKAKLCSIMTETGRKTLTEKNFIVTSRGEKKEMPINSEEEFYDLLSHEFGIAIHA
ncbi:MAG: arylamine N-acetyltransferase [Blastocatellia bacterium]|nr:arylamine N-acetyltransferase [Blastocatellia bacterium]